MALILDAVVQQYLAHAPVCLALVVDWYLWLQQFVAALCRYLQATHFLRQLYSEVCCRLRTGFFAAEPAFFIATNAQLAGLCLQQTPSIAVPA